MVLMVLMEVVAGVIVRAACGHTGGLPTVLVAKRPHGKANAGLWEFPGGKVEPGESHAEALVRELREELGVEVRVVSHVVSTSHAYPFGRVNLHAYLCHIDEGVPVALEHTALFFASAMALDTLLFASANLAIVSNVRENLTAWTALP